MNRPEKYTAQELLNLDLKHFIVDDDGFFRVSDAPLNWELYIALQIVRPLDGLSVGEARSILRTAENLLTRRHTVNLAPTIAELSECAQRQSEAATPYGI
jgi:hypothetical protein